MFPAESVARTSNVCAAWLSIAVVCGELQAAKAAVSTRHWNVAASSAVNSNVGVGSFVGPVGPAVIVVCGRRRVGCLHGPGVAAGLCSTLPTASVARTRS